MRWCRVLGVGVAAVLAGGCGAAGAGGGVVSSVAPAPVTVPVVRVPVQVIAARRQAPAVAAPVRVRARPVAARPVAPRAAAARQIPRAARAVPVRAAVSTTSTVPGPLQDGKPCATCTPGDGLPGGTGSINGVPESAPDLVVWVLFPDGRCGQTGQEEATAEGYAVLAEGVCVAGYPDSGVIVPPAPSSSSPGSVHATVTPATSTTTSSTTVAP